ncbi:MAG: alpha/beta hydrolase [Simkania sp.]|nr:alpha/beta hydrolase [Simkania sp.]MCB1074283.1 alpha/beta hydrolase [Simkania sp.]MCP5490601.1 alpha/beta hydrolase [Chlamydiales bacterium]
MANAIGAINAGSILDIQADFIFIDEEQDTEPISKKRECEVEVGVGTEAKIFIPKRSGRQERQVGFGTQVASYINSRTIVKGADRPWDKPRLIEGKYRQFQKIGGEPLVLTTRTGDQISAFHFEVGSFYREVNKMGGQFVDLELRMNHPFFENAQPIELSAKHKEAPQGAVRIPYNPDLESEFKNPKDFLAFCKVRKLEVFWEDSMQPFESASWWHFNSRKQNLVVVSSYVAKELQISSAPEAIQVNQADNFSMTFNLFRSSSVHTPAIVFEDNIDEVEQLFTCQSPKGKGLSIEASSWNMMRHNGKLYLIQKSDALDAMNSFENFHLDQLALCNVHTKALQHPRLVADRGTVVLSMHQTANFAAYSREILTFLLLGTNVLVYDYAGKGLSEGQNSQEGMTETIRSTGQYLIEEKGVDESQIMFKGQCAGGLPSSEAGKMFPRAHVWVDQSPNTFASATAEIIDKKAEKAASEETDSWLKTFSGLIRMTKPVIHAVSAMTLPSYNVAENLRQNEGIQIYTIGVPDELGYGGDELVPEQDQEQIITQVRLNPRGHFLTISGGTHVTDWWLDQNVAQAVDDIFKRSTLSASVFPEAPTTTKQAVEESFEALRGIAFDSAKASEVDMQIYNALVAVSEQDFESFSEIINGESRPLLIENGLRDVLGAAEHRNLIETAISLSRQLGYKTFTQRLMVAQRGYSI